MRKVSVREKGTEQLLLSFSMALCVAALCGRGNAQEPQLRPPNVVAKAMGYPENARLLVIQAEDLGMAHSIDKASFEALEKGWVTTAGILVPGPWFPEVLRWSRSHPNADLGIRLDLNADWSSYRWRPVSSVQKGSGITDPGGYLSSSQVSVAQHATPDEIEGEARAQIDMAKRAGMPITHLDNHMRTLLVSAGGAPFAFSPQVTAEGAPSFPLLEGWAGTKLRQPSKTYVSKAGGSGPNK